MILGLDVSTSIIGVCLLKDDKIVKTDYIDLRKTTGLLHKAKVVEDYVTSQFTRRKHRSTSLSNKP